MGIMKIDTGVPVINSFLEGGYDNDIITTIYGPAGSGKSNLCLLAAVKMIKSGKKVVYVDTEGGFSTERLGQIVSDKESVLKKIFFLKPTTFKGQKSAFNRLKQIVNSEVGLIIVDTISMLYRIEMGIKEDVQEVNNELGLQISYLVEIARKKKIPVLITNQVYSNFDERDKINMVGGDLLRYTSKCLIELQKAPHGKRRAILRKHRSIPEKDVMFEIVEKGIVGVHKKKTFGLWNN